VIGRTLLVRHKEHHKSSKLQTTKDYESKFYRTYPSIEALSQMGNHAYCRHGTFEKLQLFSGLTFSRERNTEFLISNSGIFNWPDELLKNIEKVNFAGTRSIKEKQLHMVAYLCELAYDIALGSDHNVSESPGFEMPLGIFGGGKED
jgi:hypothetical protein